MERFVLQRETKRGLRAKCAYHADPREIHDLTTDGYNSKRCDLAASTSRAKHERTQDALVGMKVGNAPLPECILPCTVLIISRIVFAIATNE